MNTRYIKRSLILLTLLVFTGAMAFAQEPQGKEEPMNAQEEAEMKAAMEAEMRAKKEMLEQERMQMKLEQQKFQEQQRKMRELEQRYADQERDMERQARESYRARELSRSSGIYSEGAYVAPVILHPNQSQLTLRNSFRGGSDTSKGEFEVEEGTRSFRCVINGKVNSGEIFIAVQYPDGKTFKELTINSAAEISFSQSLTIKEEEGKKFFGSWKYVVKAEKAEGSYMLQIMTN